MKLCFSGFERQICIARGQVTTLEIHNRVLFERICRSLVQGVGEEATEPYVLCDDNGAIVGSRGNLLVVNSPLELPWGNHALASRVNQRMVELLVDNPTLADALEGHARDMTSILSGLALEMQSEYAFGIQWDLERYLKAFSFGVEHNQFDTTFENCMRFLSLVHDVGLKCLLVFVNLKLFLSESEFEQVLQQVFFLNLSVLLLETSPDKSESGRETKYVVDQHFLEL